MRIGDVITCLLAALSSGAIALAEPCTMRVTDMNLGTYRGEEINLLGEIWLYCERYTRFRIDLRQMPAESIAISEPNRNQFIYKLYVSEDTGVRVEEGYNLIRLYGQTGDDRETIIPFTLIVPSGLDVVEGAHASSFQVELQTE